MTAVTPGRGELLALIARADKYLNTGSGEYASEIMRDMADFLRRLAAKPADDGARCVLLNQIEIMSAVSFLLSYAAPDLIGKAGALDRQRDDLLQRHKATQAALSTTGEPKR